MIYLRRYLYIVSFILLSGQVFTQAEIGIIGIGKHGNMEKFIEYDFFSSNTTFGFGLIVRKEYESNLFLSSVLSYKKIGVTTRNDLQSTIPYSYFFWKAKSVNISIEGGYYFIDNIKVEIGASLGFRLGICFDQEFSYTPEFVEVAFFMKDLFPSFDFNIEFLYKINERNKLLIRPNYNLYLDLKPNYDSVEYVTRNVGIDLGFFHTF